MKLKPKQSATAPVRCYIADLAAIDGHRAKLGLRTNAEAVAAIMRTHPDMSGDGTRRGAGKRQKQTNS